MMNPSVAAARTATAANAAAASHQAKALARPRGTRLDSDPSRLSVLSYNLLAPLYVRPIDQRTGGVQAFAAFQWASDEDLEWGTRRAKLRWELESAGADVICLQEVQFEWEKKGAAAGDHQQDGGDSGLFKLPRWLRIPGYRVRIPGQRELQQIASRNARVLRHEAAIGNALLWRSDRLELAREAEEAAPKKAREQETTRVGACLQGAPGSPLEGALGATAVFSVHLDATSEAQRVSSLHKCLEIARAMRTREALIAGDMNSELLPGSCVAAALSGSEWPSDAELRRECAGAHRLLASSVDEEPSEEAVEEAVGHSLLEEWKSLWEASKAGPEEQRVALDRAPTGPTRAAFAHGASEGPCVSWRLDHVLFTPRSLELESHWETLEGDPASEASGLPNGSCPSDHLPVAATFRVAEVPSLSGTEAEALVARLPEVGTRQQSEMAELKETFRRETLELEAEEAAAAAAASGADQDGSGAGLSSEGSGDEQEGKKKKKGRGKGKKGRGGRGGPASEAVVQLKRSQRSRDKETKAAHRLEREELCDGLSELELDALEASVDLLAWRESGGAVVSSR